MKKYKVTVSIIGSRFLGIMEAENMQEILKKVRKEGEYGAHVISLSCCLCEYG